MLSQNIQRAYWIMLALVVITLMTTSIACKATSKQVVRQAGEATAKTVTAEEPTPTVEIVTTEPVADESDPNIQVFAFGRDALNFSVELPSEWTLNLELGQQAMTAKTDVLFFARAGGTDVSVFRLQAPTDFTLEFLKDEMPAVIDQLENKSLISMEETTFLGRKAMAIVVAVTGSDFSATGTQIVFVEDGYAWYFQCDRLDDSIHLEGCPFFYDSVTVNP